MVDIKMFFYSLVFIWFDNINKIMQNPIKNVDKALLFSRNQVFCMKNWKPNIDKQLATIENKQLTNSNCHRVQYSLLKLGTGFLLTSVYKRVFGIIFILFRSWVICKNKKRSGFYTLVFYIFISNSSTKQNEKIPNTLL